MAWFGLKTAYFSPRNYEVEKQGADVKVEFSIPIFGLNGKKRLLRPHPLFRGGLGEWKASCGVVLPSFKEDWADG
jgi:hypothetical protein